MGNKRYFFPFLFYILFMRQIVNFIIYKNGQQQYINTKFIDNIRFGILYQKLDCNNKERHNRFGFYFNKKNCSRNMISKTKMVIEICC